VQLVLLQDIGASIPANELNRPVAGPGPRVSLTQPSIHGQGLPALGAGPAGWCATGVVLMPQPDSQWLVRPEAQPDGVLALRTTPNSLRRCQGLGGLDAFNQARAGVGDLVRLELQTTRGWTQRSGSFGAGTGRGLALPPNGTATLVPQRERTSRGGTWAIEPRRGEVGAFRAASELLSVECCPS